MTPAITAPVPSPPVVIVPTETSEPKVVTVVATSVTVPAGIVATVVLVAVRVNEKLPLMIRAAEALFGIVRVPRVVVIIRPFTEVGVIAPRVRVMAAAVVGLATEPETPLAVVTATLVTVPDPPGRSTKRRWVVGSTYTRTGVSPSAFDTPIRVGIEFASRFASAIVLS